MVTRQEPRPRQEANEPKKLDKKNALGAVTIYFMPENQILTEIENADRIPMGRLQRSVSRALRELNTKRAQLRAAEIMKRAKEKENV